ncbi:sigma-70 family RNA polymerase sigma factor [Sphingomonas sp. 35-24ZXX]|uniref:sigma-70 family RNA polymerase sigma factor n=1 Tax=Sphingomonas sp. 35-24ZXX TaxID=1545915 RepID=UPI00053BEA5B|nr:sigma-70 family RNA polymerase sigma factor [Sphingomonas sp. 35-24ZXX]
MTPASNERRADLQAALMRVAQQDRDALRTVYAMTSAKLHGVCLRICIDRGAAEDVLQNVYLKVWQRAGSFDPAKASAISWLCAIARNAAIDWRRSQRYEDPLPVDLAETLVDETADPSAALAQDGDRAQIFHCLAELEPARASAIRAGFFQGLSYPEIAEAMDKPVGTVKSWIRRGLMQLKECLSREQ